MIEAGAKAMYAATISRALDKLAKLNFEADDLPNIFASLFDERETGQVLIFGSYLEDRV
ncbi:MAG: hypothetical protein KGO53_09330 [Alphaproteobacteria bacterium]|nr:hypothetical protein [Alphaproteobacteria bacterium]